MEVLLASGARNTMPRAGFCDVTRHRLGDIQGETMMVETDGSRQRLWLAEILPDLTGRACPRIPNCFAILETSIGQAAERSGKVFINLLHEKPSGQVA